MSSDSRPSPSGMGTDTDWEEEDEKDWEPRHRALSNYIARALPLDPLTMDRALPGYTREAQLNEHRDFRLGRLLGAGLNQLCTEYWQDLFDRDKALFARLIFQGVGLTFGTTGFCSVSGPKLNRALQSMGINPRSEVMKYICDMIEWQDDNVASLARLQELAIGDKERAKESYSGKPTTMSVGTLTPASTSLITRYYEAWTNSQIDNEEFLANVVAVTGATHSHRLIDAVNREGKLGCKLQTIIVAAFRDIQDEAQNGPCSIRCRKADLTLQLPHISPLGARPDICSHNRRDDQQSQPSSEEELDALDDATRKRLRTVLLYRIKLPLNPTAEVSIKDRDMVHLFYRTQYLFVKWFKGMQEDGSPYGNLSSFWMLGKSSGIMLWLKV